MWYAAASVAVFFDESCSLLFLVNYFFNCVYCTCNGSDSSCDTCYKTLSESAMSLPPLSSRSANQEAFFSDRPFLWYNNSNEKWKIFHEKDENKIIVIGLDRPLLGRAPSAEVAKRLWRGQRGDSQQGIQKARYWDAKASPEWSSCSLIIWLMSERPESYSASLLVLAKKVEDIPTAQASHYRWC